MAFTIRNLSVLAYANGFTLWHYKSSKDALQEISAPDYFADAGDMLTPGDLMMTTGTDGGRVIIVAAAEERHVVTASLS
ncbi:MAG: hypothetical protein P4L90_25930 [Rhodopila sp.]|nr:hypothetical protein [Rhodopila sp.]